MTLHLLAVGAVFDHIGLGFGLELLDLLPVAHHPLPAWLPVVAVRDFSCKWVDPHIRLDPLQNLALLELEHCPPEGPLSALSCPGQVVSRCGTLVSAVLALATRQTRTLHLTRT